MTWSRWNFSPSLQPADRLTYLGEEIDFSELVTSIRTESRITLEKIDRPKNGLLRGSSRPVFQLEVEPKTLDLFHNSPWGYRGQYCMSVENGLYCNQLLLAALLDPLMACAESDPRTAGVAIDRIRQSLELPSAKIWIGEKGQVNPKDYTLVEEILHPRWISHAREARTDLDANRSPNPPDQLNAIIGVRAAYGRVLDIKGGWITNAGTEMIDEYKKHRAEHIRDYGFS